MSTTSGSTVDRQTVQAMLTGVALGRLTQVEYRFCSEASCEVVYFAADGTQFRTSEVRVPVWQKLPFGDRTVCYCFEESEASIRAELEATGRSSAVERIREHIAAQRCACEIRNPRGVCCLGDVMAAVRRVEVVVVAEGRVSPRPLAEQAQRHGLTQAEIRDLVRLDQLPGTGQCRQVQHLLQRKLTGLDARLVEIQAFRRTLRTYLTRCNRTLLHQPDAACPVVEDLRGAAK